jgi:trans-aconitate 2-methyltransferase
LPIPHSPAANRRTGQSNRNFGLEGIPAGAWRVKDRGRWYYHPVDGVAGIVDWFRGSGLRPFLQALSPSEQDAYLADYRAALAQAYPAQPDGRVLLAMPRLFIVATR